MTKNKRRPQAKCGCLPIAHLNRQLELTVAIASSTEETTTDCPFHASKKEASSGVSLRADGGSVFQTLKPRILPIRLDTFGI